MNTRRINICKAIYHSNSMGEKHKTTVGEISRATGIHYSTVKRNLVWLWDRGIVNYEEFDYKGKKARNFRCTNLGIGYAMLEKLV